MGTLISEHYVAGVTYVIFIVKSYYSILPKLCVSRCLQTVQFNHIQL